MALDFIPKDIMHRIAAKFIHAYLPEAKKPYNLRAVHQDRPGHSRHRQQGGGV